MNDQTRDLVFLIRTPRMTVPDVVPAYEQGCRSTPSTGVPCMTRSLTAGRRALSMRFVVPLGGSCEQGARPRKELDLGRGFGALRQGRPEGHQATQGGEEKGRRTRKREICGRRCRAPSSTAARNCIGARPTVLESSSKWRSQWTRERVEAWCLIPRRAASPAMHSARRRGLPIRGYGDRWTRPTYRELHGLARSNGTEVGAAYLCGVRRRFDRPRMGLASVSHK